MTIDEFGNGVKDDVCSQVQRLLQIRTGKRVIHDGEAAVSVGDARDLFDISNLHRRIGRRFDIYKSGVGAQSISNLCDISGIHIARLDPETREVAFP